MIHEIGERANRKQADPAGVETVMLAHEQSHQSEKRAAADHLLAGEEERW